MHPPCPPPSPSMSPAPSPASASSFGFELALLLGELRSEQRRNTEILLAAQAEGRRHTELMLGLENLVTHLPGQLSDIVETLVPDHPPTPPPSPSPPPVAPTPATGFGSLKEWLIAAAMLAALAATIVGKLPVSELVSVIKALRGVP